jgi:cobalt-zinc-cadmium efflux system outer membrane protein
MEAEIAEAEARIELASKKFKPDFTVGVTYGAVSSRPEMGRLVLPPDNGKDIFGINLSVNLPLQRKRRHAGLEEAAEARRVAAARQREVVTMIDRELGELVERLRLTGEQVRLFDRVLRVQAEQALRAAEAGYASGRLGSLELLDAERVLLEVRTGAERARADYAVALARLEGAVGVPLDAESTKGGER